MHVRSSAVDWRLSYDIPNLGDEITLIDLMERIPDLKKDFESLDKGIKYSVVRDMTFDKVNGIKVTVRADSFNGFQHVYSSAGYRIANNGEWCDIHADAELFSQQLPQFIHTYVDKTFGSIHELYIAEPFKNGNRYSQICVTYMLSYILGMLVRYYPTQWISLIQGEKGDAIWPSVNRAQHFVEQSFPELVIELIFDIIAHPRAFSTYSGS